MHCCVVSVMLIEEVNDNVLKIIGTASHFVTEIVNYLYLIYCLYITCIGLFGQKFKFSMPMGLCTSRLLPPQSPPQGKT